MIIVCPECSTKYKVSKESITKNGKKVKCIKCKYSWFQRNVISASLEDKTKCGVYVPAWLRLIALTFFGLAVISSVVVFRNCLATKFAFMEGIYDKIGMPSISQMELSNVVMYEKDNGVIDVNGFIVNYAKTSRRIPIILVNFISDKGLLITRSICPPLHYLKPGEKYPFFKMIHDLPKGARIISVEVADKLGVSY